MLYLKIYFNDTDYDHHTHYDNISTMNEEMSNNPIDALSNIRNGALVRLRLRWIEDRLWWVGSISRSDLVTRFEISAPQATNDFSLYQKLAPNNMQYDVKKKLYVIGELFVPLFEKDHESWLTNSAEENEKLRCIDVATVKFLRRGIASEIAQVIIRSSKSKTPLRIIYQSMKTDSSVERIICPHSIVETHIRCHIRAWDFARQAFVDLVPSRILKFESDDSKPWVEQEEDDQWNKMVEIILIPSKKLTDSQRIITERDYRMTSGRLIITVRACMVYYQLSAMYLVDAVRDFQGQPNERDFGIAVENWADLRPYTKESSK